MAEQRNDPEDTPIPDAALAEPVIAATAGDQYQDGQTEQQYRE